MSYEAFIASKVKDYEGSGFAVRKLNEHLFPFQKHIVKLALAKGRYAIFADCGLGKTIMQLEWAHQVAKHTKGKVLILAPLAVSAQTIREGAKFGIEVAKYPEPAEIQITNYEQLAHINPEDFAGVVLDESGILKSFEGKTKKLILSAFERTPYKLACTATPSPNDFEEIGNHAEFLNIMTRLEMLAMYFTHDGGETSKWRVKRHAYDKFFGWVSAWATMITKPSDIGFSDDGYLLSKLVYHEHHTKSGEAPDGMLFSDVAVSATDFNAELRRTMSDRVAQVVEIVSGIKKKEPIIIWVKQDVEAEAVCAAIPGAVEVRGSEPAHAKEKKLLGFADGDFRIMVTKTKIAQFGLNYQNCSHQIFMSPDFSFEGLYQAVRRSYRFGQKNDVHIHLVIASTMGNVIRAIKQKNAQFEQMQQSMAKAINYQEKKKEMSKTERIEGEQFKLIHGDCVENIKTLGDGAADFSIFSPPFAELYVYNDDPRDMGNSTSYDQFVEHFRFLVAELARVIKPGRLCAVHCMDLPIQKGKEGFIGLRDFSGMLLQMFGAARFIYHSRVTIWKDPVVEMQRTKALGLLHKQLKKDSSMSRVGIPDYLMVFRNAGENAVPIQKSINVDLWQQWASPVWMDIKQGNTLNAAAGRDEKDEKHICPLQLDTIERAICLWSNPGETVFTPFMGIGSEVYQAIMCGRKGIGIELKKSYFDQAHKNILAAVKQSSQMEFAI